MKTQSTEKTDPGSPEYLASLYKRHYQGAIVRSGASLAMWLFALAAFLAGTIQMIHFTGMTLAVIYLIAINPPTLFLLKRITRIPSYKFASLLINFLEIHPGQKAIVASDFSETDRVKEARRLGAGKYVKKPYTMENIARAVRVELYR